MFLTMTYAFAGAAIVTLTAHLQYTTRLGYGLIVGTALFAAGFGFGMASNVSPDSPAFGLVIGLSISGVLVFIGSALALALRRNITQTTLLKWTFLGTAGGLFFAMFWLALLN